MSNYEAQWAAFPRDLGDGEVFVYANLDYLEGPDDTRPTLIQIKMALLDEPQDDDTGERWDAIDDEVLPVMDEAGALFVGRVANPGGCLMVFYTADPDPDLDGVKTLLAAHEELEVEMEHHADPEWDCYAAIIAPDARGMRFIQDQQVLMALEEAGDDMTTPREIEHFAYFEAKKARDNFERWAVTNKFKVKNRRDPQAGDKDDDDSFMLCFTHHGPPDISEIFERTSAAAEAVEDHGGEYDGWGCEPVIRKK